MPNTEDYFYGIIQEQFKTIKDLTDKIISLTVDYNKAIASIASNTQSEINMAALVKELEETTTSSNKSSMGIGQRVITAN
jgi:hypothetical protein